MSVLCENALVFELIDTKAGQWNMDLLQAILNHKDIVQIMQILVIGEEVSDKLVWGENLDGKFTVKNAYYL